MAYDKEGYAGKWLSTEDGAHFFVRNGETAKQAILRFRASQMVNGLPNMAQRILEYERRFGEIATSELKDSLQQELPSGGVTVRKADEKEMTPDEKIASVHIDFTKDNILPPLGMDTMRKLGLQESKAVLLKASIIKKNLSNHGDVNEEVMQNIITEALYNPIDVFPANPQKPNYYHLAAFVEVETLDGLKMGLVLLDVDPNKKYVVIGHAYFVGYDGFERAKNKVKNKNE